MALKLNVITGSTRPGRVGPKVAKWVADAAADHGLFEVVTVDLHDFALPLLDEAAHPRMQKYEHDHTKRWSATIAAADAFVFVTPEYDYFPPASLVNAVQVLSVEWGYKPAGVVSYGGISGGLRSSEALRSLLGVVNMHAIPQTVPVPMVAQFMGEDGTFAPNEPMTQGLAGMLDELHKWAGPLHTLRNPG
ncbi:NADPH-dependent FMN reductase [Acidimangrovimonas sediminis]|uniref:NADPH-dependent FMN reductase n=1 Tax=Acidimangrovimonas sediminis TaxID=2056283 RepID=UPI000C80F08E|nr:NADPH-dependent FMN reductase [Acidimangrovimonas sediminis]